MDQTKPLLVGESNPYGNDPSFALYPAPEGCAGWRLCTLVFGMGRRAYMERFDRFNLCSGPWSMKMARKMAGIIWRQSVDMGRPAIILLGRKVATAFSVEGLVQDPFTVETNCADTVCVCLPHPSGLCRTWNEPGAFDRARATMREAGIEL